MTADSGAVSVVAGGLGNTARGYAATVPGGYYNQANGSYSFAAGDQAQALHNGAFVWADSQGTPFLSTGNDQFLIRAQGGVSIGTSNTIAGGFTLNTNMYLSAHTLYLRGVDEPGNPNDHNHGLAYCGNGITNFPNIAVQPDGPVLWGFSGGALAVMNGGAHAVLTWTNGGVSVNGGFSFSSDRAVKSDFTPLNPEDVLARVAALPLTSWTYTNDLSARHIGPMAQDFYAAFQVNGADDTHINVGDETGVALAAIQGLNQKLEAQAKAKDLEIQDLKHRLEELERRVSGAR